MIKAVIAGVAAVLLGGSLALVDSGSSSVAMAQPESGPVARGLIVRTDPGISSLITTRSAARSVVGAAASPTPVSGSTSLIEFDSDLPLEQAQRLAEELSAQPGIVWAEPDVLLTPAEAVFPNDPLFDEQWYLWDSDDTAGGFSVRAPQVWGATTGDDSVVVAVIDTGVADHPDLAGTVRPGYDFVSNIPMANDGDSWDPNPADPGDWVSSADIASGEFPSSCVSTSNSSWHGTHVAGIAAAVQDNDYGISGAAPGVTILNVRALGKCGGFLSDIAAAVRWAVGDVVLDRNTGVPLPVNPTPASVVNLSLGGTASCSTAMSEAVSIATDRGALVIAAAGNSSAPLGEYVPANCPGVLSVVATDRDGARASYSNYGTDADPASIAAPGGGTISAILATDNTGRQGPEQPDFGSKRGTSMATPLVSAAAALLYSVGLDSPDTVRSRLLESVQPFPNNVGSPCTLTECGTGIVDFGRLVDSITITGERGVVRDRPGVLVDGTTFGLPEGMILTPYYKFPGQTSYSPGTGVRTVSIVEGIRGEFTWQRRTGKKIYVYFRAENGERSNRIIFPPK